MYSPKSTPKYDYTKEICEKDEDFLNIFETEKEFRAGLPKILKASDDEDEKLRENLVCKIKKICDDYELADDTFFRAVFLYDLQTRSCHTGWEDKCILENKPLEDLFIFAEGEENEK